jgi:hypothetical protein
MLLVMLPRCSKARIGFLDRTQVNSFDGVVAIHRVDQQDRVARLIKRNRLEIGQALRDLRDRILHSVLAGQRFHPLLSAPAGCIVGAHKVETQARRKTRLLFPQPRHGLEQD